MKTKFASALRTTVVVAALLFVPAFAAEKSFAKDQAKQLLELRGSMPVAAAGPYVEVGTFQIQVVAKLGEPAAKLADGTWLYPHFRVEDSEAAGTLVVRFDKGRVSDLLLATPAVALTLQKTTGKLRVADRK